MAWFGTLAVALKVSWHLSLLPDTSNILSTPGLDPGPLCFSAQAPLSYCCPRNESHLLDFSLVPPWSTL